MEEWQIEQLAAQLQKPEGNKGIKTGTWMNQRNEKLNLDALAALNASNQDVILEIGMNQQIGYT